MRNPRMVRAGAVELVAVGLGLVLMVPFLISPTYLAPSSRRRSVPVAGGFDHLGDLVDHQLRIVVGDVMGGVRHACSA